MMPSASSSSFSNLLRRTHSTFADLHASSMANKTRIVEGRKAWACQVRKFSDAVSVFQATRSSAVDYNGRGRLVTAVNSPRTPPSPRPSSTQRYSRSASPRPALSTSWTCPHHPPRARQHPSSAGNVREFVGQDNTNLSSSEREGAPKEREGAGRSGRKWVVACRV